MCTKVIEEEARLGERSVEFSHWLRAENKGGGALGLWDERKTQVCQEIEDDDDDGDLLDAMDPDEKEEDDRRIRDLHIPAGMLERQQAAAECLQLMAVSCKPQFLPHVESSVELCARLLPRATGLTSP